MKKILLGAAISAALFGGVANAAITFDPKTNMPTAATLADTQVVYLSGSSAQAELFDRSLLVGTSESICKLGTVHKFMDPPSGSNQLVYLCALNTAANGSATPNTRIPSTITKSNILLFKRNEGGSVFGISPIITPAAIAFLNVTTNTSPCTVIAPGLFASTRTCAYSKDTNRTLATPTFGVSDVNPQSFTVAGENAPAGTVPAAPPGPTPSTYQVVSGPATVFGLAVTTKLRKALQQAQFAANSTCNPTNAGYKDLAGNAKDTADSELCMPNLNSDTIAAIFAAYTAPFSPLVANVSAPALGAGKIHQWTQIKTGAATNLFDQTISANKPANAKVHICSRTIGSGTRAQFGIKFLNNTCSLYSSKVVSHADHTAIGEPGQSFFKAGPIANPESLLRPMVHAMASGGGLEECLNELDNGSANTAGSFAPGEAYGAPGATAVRWAIGFHSLDKNASLSSNFRFIKIDGVSPSLDKVAAGRYPDWVEGTFQYNVKTLPSSGVKDLVLEMIRSFGTPSVVSFVNKSSGTHTWGTSGFLAVPNAAHAAPLNGLVNLAAPVNPLSHAIFPGTGAQATNDCRNPLIYSTSPNNNLQGLQIK
ncbi:MAG: hypothetical protein PHH59_01785 [Methylovulum sp.]|uniref:hypothetical protein n=1 Tax=Methylovulum sp. TaxID=1916980 RepID=UPI002619073F|nr:hypothetical protein [Methylovulum sp.]MDD2722740.1 hypothetical protein [Methylovulum sp.]MDD5123962.1 hypothetical protein [Methylovulum sp.]